MEFLLSLRGYFNDAIDILIVSYIIYQVLVLLRGTRGVQLLQGMTVLVLIWILSNVFDLKTLGWMIEKVFSVGIIAIMIIFQPELRRALERLGRGGLLGRSRQVEEQLTTQVVGELTKAVTDLAASRTGALIVIERVTGLNDYMETGVKLEATLSSELIQNIFFPNSPLHDGAVIIRNKQMMAAGCYLPLTENPFISKALGTRHRAGIGISENSDALVIIVSEETGLISIALKGKIERGLSEKQLVSRLYEELKPSAKKKASATMWRWSRKGDDTADE
ncbi:TIGR00159 family protein [Hazenella sp. IB182357]|uniref:Diadenylate cyclase n=1 Tax=Polycladospora coralii TaxID=2771432 RepID=A0A926NHB3_9BACL|nr:diadenylate cyclase CdaA [Polycladospora coralii]MBD1373554.1 TIGR00159 family protein [Polycladospora coralii]MBS7531923.1 diadenylate cyclase CdaA [Polycladospora coralii]